MGEVTTAQEGPGLSGKGKGSILRRGQCSLGQEGRERGIVLDI